jgi:hypothetical protein
LAMAVRECRIGSVAATRLILKIATSVETVVSQSPVFLGERMSSYLNLPTETFFEECQRRTVLSKVRIAQKQKTVRDDKSPMVWHTYFQLTAIDLADNVILRSTIPISSSLSNPWEKNNPFEDDVKHYNERHDKLLKAVEELAKKYYPGFGDPNGKILEGEWAWE